ncbi:hypothetical protein CVT26_006872 [Gymnopilus dilepis]|uniref:DUF5648 domain-containing protein n=1 Tax=Gymnopilus dilepis TaxID=231916 RepID=A0A409W0Q1_9AGAR|nr:hypothetical protein CVT26_006872 [Gymnopilus dilepis]
MLKLLLTFWLASLLASALSGPTPKRRDANTCADPTLAEVWLQAYSPSQKAHAIDEAADFATAVDNGADWQIQKAEFIAWKTPQEFTVPLYVLNNPTTQDFIYIMSTDGTVPQASGFNTQGIVGYVYPTQTCGSVPLFALFQDTFGDHWHTTSVPERESFIRTGWIDSGTVAFVLPLPS